MASISFNNIKKSFGKKNILSDINIEIKDGELFTFLGPSGCGKTTLLRILAGFETCDSGTVKLNQKNITDLTPEKRDISMIFQNYALFPNMNVAENVGYGLRVRGIDKKIIREKVEHNLNMVGMSDFYDRNVDELSGGEQQRVSIARALAIDPEVLLLDEPLSNLDAKLRESMRVEIRELQQKLGITMIFVTHDQQEAMSISDRIAVLNQGKVIQIDRPIDLYNNPKNEFIAGFIDESNIIERSHFKSLGIDVEAKKVSIRPQDFIICGYRNLDGNINGKIVNQDFNGSHTVYHCLVDDIIIKITEPNRFRHEMKSIGDSVLIDLDQEAIRELAE